MRRRAGLAARRLLNRRERGETLVEYGLILLFIVLVVIVVVALTGPVVSQFYGDVSDQFP